MSPNTGIDNDPDQELSTVATPASDPQIAPTASWQENRFLIPCDCADVDQPCGTWLELTQEGILILEDKDGMRISCCLPDWLEDPLRYAAQRHLLKLSAARALAIVFEYDGSDRMTLTYVTATLKDVYDTAVWLAHINDTMLSDINIRFTGTAVTQSSTAATDGPSDPSVADDVPF